MSLAGIVGKSVVPALGRTGWEKAAAARPSLDRMPPAEQPHLQRQEMHFL